MNRMIKALLCLSALLLGSCAGTETAFGVLRGNLLFRRGEDAMAAFKYLQAARSPGGGNWRDWIDYNLGSLYVSLGELKPGVRVLSRSLDGYDGLSAPPGRWKRELFYRGQFNLGVAHYESGDYRRAATAFMEALRLKPDSWDAKVNLELSIAALKKAASTAKAQSVPAAPDSAGKKADRESEELLQSVHREEKPAWASAPSQGTLEKDW
jgi:tetratricopeptide (TPR) repeat protein